MLAMLEMVKTYPTFDVSLSWKGQKTRRENSVLSNPKIRQDYRVFDNQSKNVSKLRAKRATCIFKIVY